MSAAVAVFGIALLAALLYAVLEKQAPAYALLPVSYTHLDVYKRQSWHTAAFR